MLDCVIIGAGPAGLAAARKLSRIGLSFVVLEAEPSPGGRARTTACHGFPLERGAAFLTTFYPRALALAAEAGVRLERPGFHPGREVRRQALLIDGRLHAHDIGTVTGFLRFPFVPAIQKIRTAMSLLRDLAGTHLHVADIDSLVAHDREDARAWAQRALGPQAYEYFARLAFEPFFFGEASETSAAVVRALLRHSFRWRLLAPHGGMGSLFESLARGLPIEYEARVTRVDRERAGFAVEYAGGVQRARAVVVAIPPPATRTVTLPVDADDLDILRQVRFLPSVRLNLGYDAVGMLDPLAITPAGQGGHPVIGIGAISAWMHGAAPAGKEVVRISASGWRSEALLGLPTQQVVDGLLSDCRALDVLLPAHDWAEVFEERHAIVRTPPGHFIESRRFGRRDRGGLHFAGDWLTGSTIEGAVRSGEDAAAQTAAAIRAIRSPAVVRVT